MHGSPEPGNPFPVGGESNLAAKDIPPKPPLTDFTRPAHQKALPANDLEAALQLLVERARYITGATGAALALLQGEEMVCRASAGSCAPAVDARLQVRSGLTGESMSRRQLLRCDNAENDPRVNLDACRELGIASIVVLPLLGRTGEVRGLFELFSDHAYAFEERDLIALERMADLTRTALDLSEKREVSVVAAPRAAESQPVEPPAAAGPPTTILETLPTTKVDVIPEAPPIPEATANLEGAASPEGTPTAVIADPEIPSVPENTAPQAPTADTVDPQASPVSAPPPAETPAPTTEDPGALAQPQPVPEAMLRVQKCASCGFPVSLGRTLCVDCENKQPPRSETAMESIPAEFVPDFLSSQKPPSDSWLADHVNVLAILVLILSIIVAVVIFR